MGFVKRLRWQLIIYDLLVWTLIDLHYIIYEQLSSYDAIHHFLVTILITLGVRLLFGVYYQVWRYGGVQSYLRLLVADVASFIINTVVVMSLDINKVAFEWLLALAGLNTIVALGMRMCYRYAYKCASEETLRGRVMLFLFRVFSGNKNFKRREDNIKKTKVGIIGAGKIGVNLAEELMNNPTSSYQPACFLDLSQEKV
ncbi:MAG: polysaccharide biosynthesis protein, partial [Saccharofermentans sp.]|nr:polysaccharide biosynthesis protein [Saccharofermentans sp.]